MDLLKVASRKLFLTTNMDFLFEFSNFSSHVSFLESKYFRLGHRPYDRKADRLYDRGIGSNIRSKDVSGSGINRKQMEIDCCHP